MVIPTSVWILLLSWAFMYGIAYELGLSRVERAGWSKRDSFMFASVAWGSVLVVLTESLSFFDAIEQKTLRAAWLVVLVLAAGIWLYLRWQRWKREGPGSLLPKPPYFNPERSELSLLVAIMTGLGGFLILTTCLIAYFSVPSNFDALGYHLTRVMYWQQQHSVAHFATYYINQNQLNPFAEFVILHFQVLTQNDRFADLVQWFAMLLSTVGVSQIAAKLGGDRVTQVVAALLNLAIPIGLLESVTAQNDYVVASGLACFASFGLSLSQAEPKTRWYWTVGCGLALGLSLLTKALTFVYAPLLGLLFGGFLVYKLRWRAIKYGLVIAALVLALTAGFFWRNIVTYGSPNGPSDKLTNELFGPDALVANVIRNVAINLPQNNTVGPFTTVGSLGVEWLRLVYHLTGLSETDRRISWDDGNLFDTFRARPVSSEDIAGNPAHLVLILLTLGLVFVRPNQLITRWYILALTGGFLLFNFVLKWQPWHTRLQLPLFVLWCAPIAVVLFGQRRSWWGKVVLLVPIAIALVAVNLSTSMEKHPLSSPTAFPLKDRTSYYLTADMNVPVHKDYVDMIKIINDTGCNKITMDVDFSTPEYPFWAMLRETNFKGEIEHQYVDEATKPLLKKDFQPCAIVTAYPFHLKNIKDLIEHKYANGVNLYTTPAYTSKPAKTPTGFQLSQELGVDLKSGWYNFENDANIRWMQTPSEMWVYAPQDGTLADLQLKPYLMQTATGFGDSGQLRVSLNGDLVAAQLQVHNYNVSNLQLRLKKGYNLLRLELAAGNTSPTTKEPRPLAIAFFPITLTVENNR